jgi:hypothetical protein
MDAEDDAHITVGKHYVIKANKWGTECTGSFAVNVLFNGDKCSLCVCHKIQA